jgi:arylsulfatase A-like enzyme
MLAGGTLMNVKRSLLAAAATCLTAGFGAAQAQEGRPNILLIVADDLGYADIGPYGGEIPTPNIDALAQGGVMFTDFYANSTCAATRAMLMTGMDNHLVGVGRQRATPEAANVRAGYEQVLSDRAVTLPEMLKQAGYRTAMAGKWHLGSAWEQQPQNRGFDESAVFLEGAAAHYKQEVMGIRQGEGFTFMHDGKVAEVPEDYYSTHYFADQIIDSIGDGSEDQPFFAFAAFTSPHWPLQAPDEEIAAFKGDYDAGWEALASERIARQKESGLLPADYPETRPFEKVKPWSELSPEEKARSSREMEVYAAMVSDLDKQIGRIVEHLRQINAYDDTLIMFMSDNGAEGALRPNPEWIAENFDNSLDNIGRKNSFVAYGPGWAQAGMATDRMFKMTPYGGGDHVPAIVSFPGHFPARRVDTPATVTDIMPTFLNMAGIEHPGIRNDKRDVLPLAGTSMVDLLEGKTDKLRPEGHAFGYELNQSAMLRKGNWKIIFDASDKNKAWRLYDMDSTAPEQEDVSASHPEVMADMLMSFRDWAQTNNVGLNGDLSPRDSVSP